MKENRDLQGSRGKGSFHWIGFAAILFIIAAIVTGVLVFEFTRQAIASWDVTSLPGVAIKPTTGLILNPQGTPISQGTEASQPSVPGDGISPGILLPTPDPWNGSSRVTILILGLDYGDWSSADRVGPPRSDTMILLTVDPISKTAGILSIPRDLWVNIPGMGYNKINTANRFGDLYKVPGGGPGLAMKTVEGLLGVPVNYYAQIDFYAFEKFIDDIGGVDVNVPAEIKVDPIGPHNTVVLQPGINHLDGPTALGYARNRYTAGDDADRSARQQQVIFAIRDRILSKDMLPTLVYKAPALYQELASGVHTNLALEQVIQLAWLAKSIPRQNIKNAVIGPNQAPPAVSPDGLDIYKPIPSKIRELRDEIFMSGPNYPSIDSLTPEARMQAEQPRLAVIDAAGNPDLAARTVDYLKSKGFSIQETKTAPVQGTTQVIDHTGKPYTVKYLVELMSLTWNKLTSKYNPQSSVDIEIILGKDWAASNTLPKQ